MAQGRSQMLAGMREGGYFLLQALPASPVTSRSAYDGQIDLHSLVSGTKISPAPTFRVAATQPLCDCPCSLVHPASGITGVRFSVGSPLQKAAVFQH
jgi:hypothetical protein